MFKALLPAAAALGLIAFGAQTQSQGVADAPAAMAWHLSHEGDLVKLAYGVENSDQLALMMTCAPGDRTAVVYGEVQPRSAHLQRASFGPTEMDPLSGGDAVETRIGLGDPTLVRLSEGRGLAVQGEAGAFDLPTTRAEQRMIQGFLAYCGSAHV